MRAAGGSGGDRVSDRSGECVERGLDREPRQGMGTEASTGREDHDEHSYSLSRRRGAHGVAKKGPFDARDSVRPLAATATGLASRRVAYSMHKDVAPIVAKKMREFWTARQR